MRRAIIATIAVIGIAAAGAQVISVGGGGGVPGDPDQFATKADLADKADASAVATLQAQIPTPSTAVPGMEMVGGAVGTAGTYRPGNAVQPRTSRTASCAVTLSGGIGSCTTTWEGSSFPAGTTVRLAGAPAVVDTGVGAASEQPLTCKAYGLSVSGISFRCWQAQASLLSALGASILPFSAPASGLTVQVTALPRS